TFHVRTGLPQRGGTRQAPQGTIARSIPRSIWSRREDDPATIASRIVPSAEPFAPRSEKAVKIVLKNTGRRWSAPSDPRVSDTVHVPDSQGWSRPRRGS